MTAAAHSAHTAPDLPPRRIAIVGSPTALGGHLAGMERTPEELRSRGLVERLRSRPQRTGVAWDDRGDAANDPGWAPDPDPRAKNRGRIVEYLGRLADHVAASLGPDPVVRLLVLGGDCTSHAGALAGIRRARPGIRLGLAWFDAHGDFNTPDTTPSGNVWGMPFAMACGRGDADLVAACDGPTIREADAALLGGQVLDETEARMLATSAVAQFGAGMLADEAGMAALDGWARAVASRVDAFYVAFDLDALDARDGWAVMMPEPDGLSLETAVRAIRTIAGAAPIAGFGATAARFGHGGDADRTVEGIATLTEAALG